MSTQLGSMVLMNSQGHAASNFFGWRDQRVLEQHPSGAGSYYQILQERIGARHRREMGNELPAGSPATFLFWLAEQGKLDPGLIPVSLGDFVLSSLCQEPPSVDITTAMTYELLNLVHLAMAPRCDPAIGSLCRPLANLAKTRGTRRNPKDRSGQHAMLRRCWRLSLRFVRGSALRR